MISLSIDVTLLDKSKFKRITRKSGEPAVFCDLILIETPGGRHGDFMVKQDSTKEERESGTKTPILGNGKYVGQSKSRPEPPPAGLGEEDEIPF